MYEFLFHGHSGLRYLVLLAGAVALVYAAVGLAAGRDYDRGVRITSLAYAGLLHLQVLVGFFLLVSGRFRTALVMHIFLALLAAVVAQLPPSVMRRRPPEERTHAPHVVGTAVSLVLIVLAILAVTDSVL